MVAPRIPNPPFPKPSPQRTPEASTVHHPVAHVQATKRVALCLAPRCTSEAAAPRRRRWRRRGREMATDEGRWEVRCQGGDAKEQFYAEYPRVSVSASPHRRPAYTGGTGEAWLAVPVATIIPCAGGGDWSGGCRPSPRKLSVDSRMMVLVRSRVATTISGDSILVRMWRQTVRGGPLSWAWLASTNSFSCSIAPGRGQCAQR